MFTPKMSNLEFALKYASEFKWKIFPIKTRSKIPITQHGFKDATTDEKQIKQWWLECPQSGVGVATGLTSGIGVLDIDPRNGGWESLEKCDEVFETPLISITGGGGQHRFFKVTDEFPSFKFRPGLDIKGDLGYIILPPSIHPSGNSYSWNTSIFEYTNIPSFPHIEVYNKKARRCDVIEVLTHLQEGNRNDSFARIIGKFKRAGFDQDEVLFILAPHAEKTGFDVKELTYEIEGIFKRYPKGETWKRGKKKPLWEM